MWPQRRAHELMQKARSLRSKKKIKVVFEPSPETHFIRYFSQGGAKTLASYGDDRFEIVHEVNPQDTDILILTSHGSDLSVPLWGVRSTFTNTILVLWLWDNHLAHLYNYKNALAVDYLFPSHKYDSDYLHNPLSVAGVHVPACSAQWSYTEAKVLFQKFLMLPRSDKLLVNYVNYPFSWRSQLLRRLASEVSQADVFLMEPNDRSRYFNKNAEERFKEWMGHKTSLILPVDKDLSTRVFDGLLAGQVLLVPKMIADFDEVIPPAMQSELGIVRLETCETLEIVRAIGEAVARFDRDGVEGMVKRHRFVLDHHLLGNRIQTIVNQIFDIANGKRLITFANRGKTYSLAATKPA